MCCCFFNSGHFWPCELLEIKPHFFTLYFFYEPANVISITSQYVSCLIAFCTGNYLLIYTSHFMLFFTDKAFEGMSFKSLGSVTFFVCVFERSLFFSQRLHLFDQKYSKNVITILSNCTPPPNILWWIQSSKEQHFYEIEIFCDFVNIFTVTFDQFNVSMLNKSIKVFFKKRKKCPFLYLTF